MSHRKIADESIFLFTALIVTFILFYIDEGYYDLRWMKNIGNWIIFIFYISVLFSAQYILYLLFNNLIRNKRLARRISFTGIFIGLFLLLFVIFGP